MYWTLRDDVMRAHAGHPKEMREALEELDSSLESAAPVSLSDPAREAAIAALLS